MSKFEETIIPLMGDIWSIDLTSAAGFVDSYTEDPDRPNSEPELFLMYKNDKHNEYTENRIRRLEASKNLKRIYVKYIGGQAYYIYSFWVKPEIKKLYSGIINLSTAQKAQVLQFWGLCETVTSLLENHTCVFNVQHSMTPEDFRESAFNKVGLRISKKGGVS